FASPGSPDTCTVDCPFSRQVTERPWSQPLTLQQLGNSRPYQQGTSFSANILCFIRFYAFLSRIGAYNTLGNQGSKPKESNGKFGKCCKKARGVTRRLRRRPHESSPSSWEASLEITANRSHAWERLYRLPRVVSLPWGKGKGYLGGLTS
ncbi:hypothetical protein HAX54_011913, partial [Datura stramonium]|nr:hypothetical protein [Datura stramonium]